MLIINFFAKHFNIKRIGKKIYKNTYWLSPLPPHPPKKKSGGEMSKSLVIEVDNRAVDASSSSGLVINFGGLCLTNFTYHTENLKIFYQI